MHVQQMAWRVPKTTDREGEKECRKIEGDREAEEKEREKRNIEGVESRNTELGGRKILRE